MTKKLCHKCGRELPLDHFPKDGSSPCSECRAFRCTEYTRKRRRAGRADYNAYMRDWRARNPGYNSRKKPQKYDPAKYQRYKAKHQPKEVEDNPV